MALFPSLPENPHLSDLLTRFPDRVMPLVAYTNAVLRGEGALSIGQRELIAAYVSGLNACRFCFDSHVIYAQAFGIPEGQIKALVDDFDGADIAAEMRPLLAYVRKLNHLPPKLTQGDAQAVFEAGWSEEALFEAVEVTGLFNLFNRLVEGGGVTFDYAAAPTANLEPEALANSYLEFGGRIARKAKPR